jgi:pimeloyl-ACP methyl ester carboxylesterase
LYSIDAPGHGLSSGTFLTVPLYSEVIEKVMLDLGEFKAIIGHSLGSFTTLYTLHRNVALSVNKLVLLASPGEATEFFAFYKKSIGLTDKTITAIKGYFEKFIGEKVEYFSATSFARAVDRPALLIHDEEDEETPYVHSLNIHKALKGSQLRITRGLTHNLKSKSIVDQVISFVQDEPKQASKVERPELSITNK